MVPVHGAQDGGYATVAAASNPMYTVASNARDGHADYAAVGTSAHASAAGEAAVFNVPMEGYGDPRVLAEMAAAVKAAAAPAGASGEKEAALAPTLWHESWLYPQLGRAEVEAALTRGGTEDGRFLVRRKEADNVYALSVLVKGKATHHLIVKDESGWHVNGFALPQCHGLAEVVEYVRLPRPNVNQQHALTTPVHG